MALSPLIGVPVAWQTALVDIQPTSQYGQPHDVALISTTMQLQQPQAEDITFVLPLEDDPIDTPVLRLVQDDGTTTSCPVEAGELPADVQAALEPAGSDPERELWNRVIAEARGGVRAVVAHITRADQLVRLAYPIRVPATDGVFELRVLAPLASFVLNPGGGDISFAVGLPRIPGRNVTIVETVVENPPGSPAGAFGQPETLLAERKFAAHYLKLDPIYRLKYKYE
jgi:hypothetical protein